MWRLTFELSGRRRQDARPGLAKMYCVPPDRAWWPAVGAPLERGVRPHRAAHARLCLRRDGTAELAPLVSMWAGLATGQVFPRRRHGRDQEGRTRCAHAQPGARGRKLRMPRAQLPLYSWCLPPASPREGPVQRLVDRCLQSLLRSQRTVRQGAYSCEPRLVLPWRSVLGKSNPRSSEPRSPAASSRLKQPGRRR